MTSAEAIELKKMIHEKAIQLIKNRIATAEAAVIGVVESKKSETKSSAGDKFETGRAMMQIEQEKSEMQLGRARALLRILENLKNEIGTQSVAIGSLVQANTGWYFVAIGLGKLIVEDTLIYVISPQSPIGKLLIGTKPGDTTIFRALSIEIQAIF